MSVSTDSERRSRRRSGRLLLGLPYWVGTTALAVLFLFPLVWTAISSFGPRAGTSQAQGWGIGNYVALANFQAGIWVYVGNSLFVSLVAVTLTLIISFLAVCRNQTRNC